MEMVPLTSATASSFEIQIEGVVYSISIRRNSRQDVWVASFYTVTKKPLAVGIPLVLGTTLVEHHALPFRGLFMYSTDSQVLEDAGPEDLGTRVIMVKFTEAELATLDPIVNVTLTPPTQFLNGDGVQFLTLEFVELLDG